MHENTPLHVHKKWTQNAIKTTIRQDTIKLLEENISKMLCNINHTNVFLGQSPKAIEIKTKNKQMGANQAYKLFYSKGSHKQNEMTTYGMGKKICKQCDQSGLISEVYKQLTQLNNIKRKIKKKNEQNT